MLSLLCIQSKAGPIFIVSLSLLLLLVAHRSSLADGSSLLATGRGRQVVVFCMSSSLHDPDERVVHMNHDAGST